MATVITSECINCGACEPECPNAAIYAGGAEWELNGVKQPALSQDIFYIVPEKCSECVGFHDREACAAVCPVDCCIPDPQRPETEDVLIARARQLHADKTFSDPFPSRFRAAGAGQAPATQAPATHAPVEKVAPTSAAASPAPVPPAAPRPASSSEPRTPRAPEPAQAPTAGAAATAEPARAGRAAPTASAPKPAPQAPAPVADAPAAEASGVPGSVATPAAEALATGRRFPGELDVTYEAALKQLQRQPTGYPSAKKLAALIALPVLGALPAADKRNLERATGDQSVFTAGATVLNVALNLLLYPAVLALALAAYSPTALGHHAFGVVVAGVLLGTLEGAFRLRDVLVGETPIDQAAYRGSLYGLVLRPFFAPILGAAPPISERGTIVVDGFHGGGFEEKMDRERRYGEVYTLDELGGGYLLRVEFPRRVPPSAIKQQLALSDEMPDYEYDLGLRDGLFTVHGRLTDPELRRVAAFSPAFPPDFTTQVALPGSVAGFVHRYEHKTLEIVLLKP